MSWPESWDGGQNILKAAGDKGRIYLFVCLFLGLCHFLPLGVALVSLCRGGHRSSAGEGTRGHPRWMGTG